MTFHLDCNKEASVAISGQPTQHVIVFDEPGRFAGRPTNNGVCSWGDEIPVGFVSGVYAVQRLSRQAVRHPR